jgi:hypothetical protein
MMDWLKNIFRTKTEAPTVAFNTHIPKLRELDEVHETESWPEWLSDEPLLRDEAVLFGLSGADVTEKLNLIESYFSKKIIVFQKEQAYFDEKILELNLEIESKNTLVAELKSKQDIALNTSSKDTYLLRTFVGLVLSLGMCYGLYMFLSFWLSPVLGQKSPWIAWGIFLTGMFNLYAPISVFHEGPKPTYRQILEGLGVPFATAVLVCVLSFNEYGVLKSLGVSFFLFVAFVFTGKLLFGNVAKLNPEMRNLMQNFKIRKDKHLAQKQWNQDLENLNDDIQSLRTEKWKLRPELDEVLAQIQKINTEKNIALQLFSSEYALAKNYLNGTKIKQLS